MRMIDNSIKNKKPVKCPVVGCSNKDPILKVSFLFVTLGEDKNMERIQFSKRPKISGPPLHRPRGSEKSGQTEKEIKRSGKG